MADLLLERVCKVFPGGAVALSDLDLHVANAEIVSVLGPSGSGKTTLLRLIAGLEQVTSGTIRLDGRPADRLPPRDRNLAMVFQEDALYPHLTVRGNLAFGAETRGVGRDEVRRRVARAAAMLGLEGLLDRLPRTLSGGERRRVAVGRTIVVEPGCTLYDEPLGGLDGETARRLRLELKEIHRRLGRTGVYVTHDHAAALALGDRVLVLAEGRVRQLGSPEEIHDTPADRFVAGFVGDPPMNFLDGVLAGGDDGRMLFEEAGGVRIALADAVRTPPGTAVVLGVRPGALRPSPDGPHAFRLLVEHVETLGDHADVFGRTPGGAGLTARVPVREKPCRGDSVSFAVDPGAVHLFEPGRFGRRLE